MRTSRLGWCIVVAVACLVSIAHGEADPEPKKAKPEKEKEPAKAESRKKVDELKAMTDDPLLARADRISGEEQKGLVAFTFDDGPNPETTPTVISALEKYDIPATFFIVTRRLLGHAGAKSRDILGRELAAGFLVQSHSMTHPNLKRASAATFAKEIDDSVRVLSKEAGRPIGMFRAPFGAIDAGGRGWLKKRGLTEVFWSIDTLDWKARDAAKLRKKVLRMILDQEGGVVLMHDVKELTAKVVPGILDDLEAENCRRLAEKKKDPIIPVSIHYFVRDRRVQRAIPEDVKKRTEAYKAALPGRCAARTSEPARPPDGSAVKAKDPMPPEARPPAAKASDPLPPEAKLPTARP